MEVLLLLLLLLLEPKQALFGKRVFLMQKPILQHCAITFPFIICRIADNTDYVVHRSCQIKGEGLPQRLRIVDEDVALMTL